MPHEIIGVEKRSPADRAGVRAGDVLIRLNGEELQDEIDYQALIAGEELCLELERQDKPLEIRLRKREEEPLGLHFGSSMVLRPRTCRNQCCFCFISQLPRGLRESLYVKDDDWRFSLMMGNYVTLTNVDEAEFQRILTRRASPLYISVHTTNPELRCRMMNNRFAGNLLERLQRLKEAGLSFHCQIVVCPGINDGEELSRTLQDLRDLWPAARTVALVPVGLTRFREGLPELKPFDQGSAARLLDQVAVFQEECREKMGTSFVFPSDEFFCLSGRDIPGEEWYEDYPQIENGVGLIRRFREEVREAAAFDERYGEGEPAKGARYVIPTGVSFAPALQEMLRELRPENVQVKVLPVVNRFFGETVTVTGLLTGGDLLQALTPEVLEGADAILLCASTLRHERDRFLDDMTLEDFRSALPVPVRVLENDGQAFWDALQGLFE